MREQRNMNNNHKSSGKKKLALILTCYNRREKTVNCINKLLPQLQRGDWEYKIYICDDKSTDGTYEILINMLPEHNIVQSGGNLYWSKGMHIAMEYAIKDDNDFYLMVNDDVDFVDDALAIMFDAYRGANVNCGIVGVTKDLNCEMYTYGGRDKNMKIVPPGSKIGCLFANWNCFLVDREVINCVGNIDGKYQHAWGDYDYAFRMNQKGFPIYTASLYVGRCNRNSMKNTYRDCTVTCKERLKMFFAPKGVPFYSFMKYHIVTEGVLKLPLYFYGYCSMLFYILMGKNIEE